MSEIVRYREHERSFELQPQIAEMARLLAGSPFVPEPIRGDAGAVFAIIVSGQGLGMDPVAALQSYDFISGKPYLRTEVMFGMFQRAGHAVQWGACTDKTATVRCTRGDGRGSAEVTYTMAMAERAGLVRKSNWLKNPAEMLRARALRSAMKMVAADVFLGTVQEDYDAPASSPAEPAVVSTVQLAPVEAPPEALRATESDEPVPEAQPPTPEPQAEAGPMVTQAQLRKLNAQLGDLERTRGEPYGRDGRRDLIRQVLGLDVLASAKDLTREQASMAVDRLDVLIAEVVEATSDVVDAEVVDPATGEVVDGADG